MSRLKERLNLLRRRSVQQDAADSRDGGKTPDEVLPEPSEQTGSDGELESERDAEWKVLGAERVQTDYGEFIRRTVHYPMDFEHGRVSFAFLAEHGEALAAMVPGGEPASCDKLLFFDTETTGLGVGAGNVPFMIGFGYFRKDQFTVEQCLLRNPAEEPAVLVYFAGVLEKFTHVVSYNGRTFDWPVLKNRCVVNRIDWQDDQLHHLDFLYPSRRLWRNLLPSCSLGSVEAGRLGFIREDDVPGTLAPALYFQFLQTGDPETLKGVFIHNENDILSLAGLASHFAAVLNGRVSYLNMEALELMHLVLWLDKIGRPQQADEACEWLLKRPEAELREVALELAGFLKRKGRMKEAVRLWELCTGDGPAFTLRLEPYIELAMYYEHRAKQPLEALRWTEKAYDIAARRASLSRRSARDKAVLEDIDKRRRRLLHKVRRISEENRTQALYAGELFE